MRIRSRRRLASAAASLALVAMLVSTLYLRNGPGGPGLGEGDDVDYYDAERHAHRRLAATRRRKAKMAFDKDRSCILITSQGGVASTAFLVALEKARRRSDAFCVNDDGDRDGFKHMPAGGYQHSSGHVSRRAKRMPPGQVARFHKVLVIVGDPIHTLESTFRRFDLVHVNKLRKNDNMVRYPQGTSLLEVYQDMARSGRDTTGLLDYVSSWHDASQDRSRWPEVRMVTSPSLFNHAVDHARWLGVAEGDLGLFEGMSFDPSKQHETQVSVGDEELAGRVREVFRPVFEVVRELDGRGSPEAGERQGEVE